MATSAVIRVNPSESEERNVWDHLPDESPKAFHAFTVYRDLGWERTVKKVVDQLKKSASLVYRWSLDYHWRDRAQAWDEFQDQVIQRQQIKQRAEFHKATLMVAQNMQSKAMQGFIALQTVKKVKDSAGNETLVLAIKPNDLVRLMESSHKLSNSVLGKGDDDKVAKIELIFGNAEDDEEVVPPGGTA